MSKNIEWEHHYKYINKRNNYSYQVQVKFIHSRLPSGKMNFDTKHNYRYCKISETPSTPHDHFLTCNHSYASINL